MPRRSSAPSAPTALVAAASRPLLDKTATVPKVSAAWQAEAWQMFDEIGEVKYACGLSGNALAKLRLFVAVRPGDDLTAEPVPIASVLPDPADPAGAEQPDEGIPEELAAQAEAELTRLKKASGGEPELLRSVQVNLEVAGELYLVGWEERSAADPYGPHPERWEVRSVSEVQWTTEGDRRKAVVGAGPGAGGGKGREVQPDRDAITRVWVRHPRFGELADSNLRGVLADCRALLVLQAQAIAEGRSRMSAGAFCVPNELTIATPHRPAATGADPPPDDLDSDPFMVRLENAMIDAIEDPTSPSSVAPFVIRGPAEFLRPEFLRPILFGRGGGGEIEAKIEARVQRLARGMNLPPEVVLGHQQTTYANAAQVDQDTFEDHYEPRARLLVDTLTVAYLRPALLDAGYPPELVDRVFVWYDASALLGSADVEANADQAFDKGAISLAAYRRVKGYDEGDAPDVLELMQRAGLQKGQLNGQLTAQLLNLLGGPQLDVPTGPEPGGGGGAEAGLGQAVAALLGLLAGASYQGAPDSYSAPQAADGGARGRHPFALAVTASTRAAPDPPGRQLLAIDTEARSTLQAAIDAAIERALERAGNRVRAKAAGSRQALARVAPRYCCAILGPGLVAAAGIDDDALIEGAFTQLEGEFRAVGARAQGRALDFTGRMVGNLETHHRRSYGLRQAQDLDQAWDWLHGQLRNVTKAKLWNPDVADPDLLPGGEGEFNPSSKTPTGLLRQALRQAGGAKGALHTGNATNSVGGEVGHDAWVSVPDGQAPGGIATGQLVHDMVVDNGGSVEGYKWVYGQADRHRPFKPHLHLDGLVFTSFTDDRLISAGAFPPTSHYIPGDHRGCICDVEPIFLTPEEAAALGLEAIKRKAPAAKKKAKAAPEVPLSGKVVAEGVPTLDTTGYKQVGKQGGSNLGGIFEAPDGSRWYLKAPKTRAHAENEVAANRLYRAMGMRAPDVRLAQLHGQFGQQEFGVASRLLDKTDDAMARIAADPAFRDAALEDFAGQAWLANWDAVGLVGDNIVNVAGQPMTIDGGGAILFRAQGTPRGALFSDDVKELTSMRVNRDKSGVVYGQLTPDASDARYVTGVHKVLSVRPADIDALVDQTYTSLSPAERDALKSTLRARRVHLARSAGLDLPEDLVGDLADDLADAVPVAPPVNLHPLGQQLPGVASYQEVTEGLRGVSATGEGRSFAFDGGDIEGMDVRVQPVQLTGVRYDTAGQATRVAVTPAADALMVARAPTQVAEAVEYNFKLTDRGSEAWRRRVLGDPGYDFDARSSPSNANRAAFDHRAAPPFDDRADVWRDSGWELQRGVRAMEPGIAKQNGGLARLDLDNAATIRGRSSTMEFGQRLDTAGTARWHGMHEGRVVTVEWSDHPPIAHGGWALRNNVRIFVERTDLADMPDERYFASLVERLGFTDQVHHPSTDDAQALVENKLIDLFGGTDRVDGALRAVDMSPQQRNDALSRAATLLDLDPADVHLVTGPDGRVVPRLPDAALRRLVDRTGVTFFTHHLSASNTDQLVDILAGDHKGLVSSSRRLADGLPFGGMSTEADYGTGGADYVFTRQQAKASINKGQHGDLVFKNTALRDLDWFAYSTDTYGNTLPTTGSYGGYSRTDFLDHLTRGASSGSNQETMFRGMMSFDHLEAIYVDDYKRAEVLRGLADRGITHLGGQPVDKVVRSTAKPGRVTPALKPKPFAATPARAATAKPLPAPPVPTPAGTPAYGTVTPGGTTAPQYQPPPSTGPPSKGKPAFTNPNAGKAHYLDPNAADPNDITGLFPPGFFPPPPPKAGGGSIGPATAKLPALAPGSAKPNMSAIYDAYEEDLKAIGADPGSAYMLADLLTNTYHAGVHADNPTATAILLHPMKKAMSMFGMLGKQPGNLLAFKAGLKAQLLEWSEDNLNELWDAVDSMPGPKALLTEVYQELNL